MSTKSKLIIAAAIATFSLASPAFAQSFNADWGTGNEMSSFYDANGGLHEGTVASKQNQTAVRESGKSGLDAFAMVSGAASGSDNPAATGGGSVGYNENLRTDY
jgi:hypothetical protein